MQLPRPFLLLILLGIPRPAPAQGPVMLRPLQFELGLRTRRTQDPESRTASTEEWIGVRLRGAVVDPRLLTFNFTARPRLIQNRLSGNFEPTGSNGRWLDLDLQLDGLRGRPLSASARFARFSFDERGYGLYMPRAYTRNLIADARVRYDNRLMPLSFAYRHEQWGWGGNAETGTDGAPTTFEIIQLDGGNRKTSFNLQQTANRNGAETTLRLADLQNRQTWGKGSSSQLTASASSQSVADVPGTRNLFAGGAVHLQHLPTVSSDWSAQAQSSSAGVFSSTTYGLSGALGWNILPALSAGLSGLRTATRYSRGSEDLIRIGPNAGLSLRLPWSVRLFVSGAVAYQHYSAQLPEGTEFVIVGERHVFDAAGSFLLDRPDVVPASIVVRSTGGVLYLPGSDYELVETGGYVRVIALPGGRPKPGDAVLVDYRYRPITTPSGPALWAEYSGSLQIRWLQVYQRRWLLQPSSTLEPTSPSSPLRLQDQQTAGAKLAVPAGWLTLMAHGELQHRRDASFDVKASSVGGSLNSRIARTLGVALGAEYLHSRGTTGTIEEVGGRSQMDWMPHRTFQIGGALMLWRTIERETIRRNRLDVSGQAVWQPGLLRVAAYYYYNRWQNTLMATDLGRVLPKHQLMLELARRF